MRSLLSIISLIFLSLPLHAAEKTGVPLNELFSSNHQLTLTCVTSGEGCVITCTNKAGHQISESSGSSTAELITDPLEKLMFIRITGDGNSGTTMVLEREAMCILDGYK